MGSLRKSNDVVLAKVESVYNTDPVPTGGTNAILVYNAVFAPEGLRMADRPAIRGFIGDLQKIYAGSLVTLSMDVEIKGSGAAGTAPEIDPLLQACAMLPTIVASTSVTYAPSSVVANMKSVTLYYYEGGRKLHKITGARGIVTFKLSAGGVPMASFKFTGHFTGPTDVSQPTGTYSSVRPTALIGLGITVNGVSIVPQDLSFDLGNKIVMPPSMNATDGYGEVQIVDRSVIGSIGTDAELASVIDYDTLLSAGTSFIITTGAIGGTAGNKVAFTTPAQAYFVNRELTDGDGQRRRTMPFAVADAPTTDSELSVIFT